MTKLLDAQASPRGMESKSAQGADVEQGHSLSVEADVSHQTGLFWG